MQYIVIYIGLDVRYREELWPCWWSFSSSWWEWGWFIIMWWIHSLWALFLHLSIQVWGITDPPHGITRSKSPCIGCSHVVTIVLPLILGVRLKFLPCITWCNGSRKIHSLRAIIMTDWSSQWWPVSNGANFSSQMALVCRRLTPSLGLSGRPHLENLSSWS